MTDRQTRADWIERPSPANVEAERALLGGLLRESTWLLEMGDLVQPSDFYRPEHERLYRLLLVMTAERTPIDLVTVAARIGAGGPKAADPYGGARYVAELPEYCPSTTNLRAYAALIVEAARRRAVLRLATDLASRAHDASMPATELIDAAIAELGELGATRSVRFPVRSWDEALAEANQRAMDAETGAAVHAVSTGFRTSGSSMPSLDEVLDGGIRPGEQCVIAGSPGMGKSALAQAIAVRMAIGGRPVLFVSLEMDRADVITRMLSHRTEIAFRKLRRPSSQSDQEAALVEDLTPHGLPMHVWFRPGASYDQVASMTRRLWMRGQCGALFVDYVQRMHHPRERGETLASAIGNTTTQFKQLAGELGIPVVVLSQLNRSFKAEPARRKAPQQGAHGWTLDVEVPSIDHLAESGRIEQDADIILFPLNAPNYGLEGKNSYGAIVVGKQRNGPRATVGVRWDGPCATYRPYGEGA